MGYRGGGKGKKKEDGKGGGKLESLSS